MTQYRFSLVAKQNSMHWFSILSFLKKIVFLSRISFKFFDSQRTSTAIFFFSIWGTTSENSNEKVLEKQTKYFHITTVHNKDVEDDGKKKITMVANWGQKKRVEKKISNQKKKNNITQIIVSERSRKKNPHNAIKNRWTHFFLLLFIFSVSKGSEPVCTYERKKKTGPSKCCLIVNTDQSMGSFHVCVFIYTLRIRSHADLTL